MTGSGREEDEEEELTITWLEAEMEGSLDEGRGMTGGMEG